MIKQLMKNKLKSNDGESIAETLVAVLIAAFALLMLAGTVNTSSNLITKSQNTLKEYYESENNLEERTGTPQTMDAKLGNDYSWSVNAYKNEQFPTKPVVVYDYQQDVQNSGQGD